MKHNKRDTNEKNGLLDYVGEGEDGMISDNTIKTRIQFILDTQLCPTLCDPVNHSRPGLPVHHQLPESTQTHVYQKHVIAM